MRPHRTDAVSLVFGLIFLSVALWWVLAQLVTLRPVQLAWGAAGALIVIGVAGLLGAIRGGRRPEPVAATAATAEVPGDLPPELHADIVRELLADPAHWPTAGPVAAGDTGPYPGPAGDAGSRPGAPGRAPDA